MKKVLLTFAILFSFTAIFAQINRGQYMVGGSFSYKSDKASPGGDQVYNTFMGSPSVGYFLIDKLAVGLDGTLTSARFKNHGTLFTKGYGYRIAPFVRYYALPATNKFNVFAEGSYGWGMNKTKYVSGGYTLKDNLRGYSFSAGPVFFVTPNVGIELSAGYYRNSTKSGQQQSGKITNKGFQTGVGFQIHLGKGKK